MVIPDTKGAAPGRDALIKALVVHWASRMPDGSDVLDFPGSPLNWLAVPVAKAFEMVGYGQRLTDEVAESRPPLFNDGKAQAKLSVLEQVDIYLKNGIKVEEWFPEWTGARLLKRQKELIAQGVRDHAVQLERETGVRQRTARRRIEELSNPPVMLSNAWNASSPRSRGKKAPP